MDLTITKILHLSQKERRTTLEVFWKELLDEMDQACEFSLVDKCPDLYLPLHNGLLPETMCEEFDRIESQLNEEVNELTELEVRWAWLIKTVTCAIENQEHPELFHLDPAVMPSGTGAELNLPRPRTRAATAPSLALSLDDRAVLFNPPETD